MDQSDEPRDVSGVEDNDYVADIGTVSLDILTQLGCDLSVPLEQIFAGHAVLTRSATRGYYVLSPGECLLDIRGKGKVQPLEAAVADFLGDTLESRGEGVIETDVRRQSHHGSSLCHVRPDHTSSAYDGKLVLC